MPNSIHEPAKITQSAPGIRMDDRNNLPEFVLWGEGPDAESTFNTLNKAGLGYAVTALAPPSWMPAGTRFTPIEHATRESRANQLYVVIPCGHLGDSAYRNRTFKTIYRQMVHRGIPHYMLKHPAALLDFLPINLTGRFFSTGMPASGNGIFGAIANHIVVHHCRHTHASDGNGLDAVLKAYAFDFDIMMQNWLADMVGAMGFWQFGVTMSSFSSGHMFASGTMIDADDGEQKRSSLTLEGVPYRYVFYNPVSMTHACLVRSELERLKSFGATSSFTIRDPVELLQSMDRKIDNAADIHRVPRRDDATKFSTTGEFIVRQRRAFDYLADNKSLFSVLNFSRLREDPVDAVLAIGGVLGASLSSRVARKIWKMYGNKQLPLASAGHFQRGTKDTSSSNIPSSTLGMLKAVGMDEIAAEFGWAGSAKLIASGTLTAAQKRDFDKIVEGGEQRQHRPDNYIGRPPLASMAVRKHFRELMLDGGRRAAIYVGSTSLAPGKEFEAKLAKPFWSGLITAGRFNPNG